MVRRQLIQQSASQAQPSQPAHVSPAIGQLPVTGAVPSLSPAIADQVQTAATSSATDGPTPESPPEDYGFAAPF